MTSTTAPTRTNGSKAPSAAGPAGARGRPAARRRQVPLILVGVLLVIGGALAFADASLHLGSREEVLVVSAPLAAGQVITSSDLETVRVSTGTGLQVVPTGDELNNRTIAFQMAHKLSLYVLHLQYFLAILV